MENRYLELTANVKYGKEETVSRDVICVRFLGGLNFGNQSTGFVNYRVLCIAHFIHKSSL